MTTNRDESKDIQVSAETLTLTQENSTYPFIGQFLPYVTGAPSDLSGWVRFVPYEQYSMLEKERDELRTNVTQLEAIRKKLEFAIVCAEDYICHFEMENDISRQEFLYIRDAAKCLRETDCV